MRKANSFLEENVSMHLFIDNIGGHGKTEVKQLHKIPKEEPNVSIKWQIPNLPETNILNHSI